MSAKYCIERGKTAFLSSSCTSLQLSSSHTHQAPPGGNQALVERLKEFSGTVCCECLLESGGCVFASNHPPLPHLGLRDTTYERNWPGLTEIKAILAILSNFMPENGRGEGLRVVDHPSVLPIKNSHRPPHQNINQSSLHVCGCFGDMNSHYVDPFLNLRDSS